MLELLAGYSLSQIVAFLIMFTLATKGGWELIDFFKEKYNKKFNKDYNSKRDKEKLEEQLGKLLENQEKLMKRCDHFDEKLEETQNLIESVTERVDDLTTSDMYDIKYSIVQAYHHFVEDQQWIDDFSMSVLESRFKIYVEDGGNSFVEDLMNKLRQLPKMPPIK